ncbi:MAG: hypothetical protein AUF76_12985 [Acidobacteria bacterium 13_1_20CM_2_65_9]|nr:MAG: hypothetical protein AUF76_12985 [Acidobacteria bacterium 13_1_20CM_2_65_9]
MRTSTSATFADWGDSSLDEARDRSLDEARDRSLDEARDRSLDEARDRSLDEARDRQDTQASTLKTQTKNPIVGFMDGFRSVPSAGAISTKNMGPSRATAGVITR